MADECDRSAGFLLQGNSNMPLYRPSDESYYHDALLVLFEVEESSKHTSLSRTSQNILENSLVGTIPSLISPESYF
jgi:hypothetical protein